MVVDQTLAQASNMLVYSAMTVYASALVAFAVDLFPQVNDEPDIGVALRRIASSIDMPSVFMRSE